MTAQIELRLPADVRNVALARLVVTAAARQSGVDDDRVEDLRIAVSEAVTNAVEAHLRGAVAAPVVLRFGPAGGSFRVTVEDAGPGFEPASSAELAARDWTEMEEGMGVTLIRGLTDDVRFIRDGGMHVDMTFTIGLDGTRSGV